MSETVEIKIPSDLQTISKTPGIHENFKQCILASSCEYIPDEKVLRIISENPEITKKRILMAQDLHLRTLKQAAKDELVIEEFDVAEDLIGLSIGSEGRNINSINKMKGVHADLIRGTCRFRVEGETQQAVKAARAKLEYVRECVQVPRSVGERIMENDGLVIQDVVKKSGITRIEVGEDDLTEEDDEIPFCFVGTVDKVADAKALFQYHSIAIENMKGPIDLTKQVSYEKSHKEPKFKYRELLTIPRELMGLAVGKHGSNIKKAETMTGIVDIKAKDNFFEIFGNDKQGIEEARKLLDINQELVEFDCYRAPRIIGKNKAMLLQIQKQSNVFRIDIKEKTDEKTSFMIIGMAHTIPDAKQLMNSIV